MMGRRRLDSLDLACLTWGRIRRQLCGLDDPRTAAEYLGSLRCTLAERRDLHAGSKSANRIEQHWPEVYTGEPARINRIYHSARPMIRAIMDAHYVARAPIDAKAQALAMSVPTYWQRLREAKAYLEGRLQI